MTPLYAAGVRPGLPALAIALGAVLCGLCSGAGTRAEAGEVTVPGLGAGQVQVRVQVESLREARFRRTVRQEHDFSCGAAAVATLLTHHYGRVTAEAEVFGEMWASGDRARIQREGFTLLDMKRFLVSRGFAADGFQISLEQLAGAGLPAIALLDLGGFRHFVVVQGVSADAVLFSDPAQGARTMDRQLFEALRYGVLLVIRSPQPPGPQERLAREWRLRPPAPLALAGGGEGLGSFALMLPRGNEF